MSPSMFHNSRCFLHDDAVEARVAGFPNLTHSAAAYGRDERIRSGLVAGRERHLGVRAGLTDQKAVTS